MIYITGDTHGRFDHIEHFCQRMNTDSKDIMIVLGDAGINYDEGRHDQLVKKQISEIPITLFCLHGNHEIRPHNIESYHESTFHGGKVMVEDTAPNILFAVDGEIYDFNGKKCIAIGGAYSVDKFYRLARGLNWWEDEQPSEQIKAAVESRLEEMNWSVDVVLSHTCPLKYEPTEVFLQGLDQSTVDKSTEVWLGSIESRLQYQKWYCGHYHTMKKIDRLQFMFGDIDAFDAQITVRKPSGIRAHLYTETKMRGSGRKREMIRDPNGCLFSGGLYPTKIKPTDLPEHYIYGYMYHQYGYISAKGVKYLIYKPNYVFDNHLFKDDFLFISYDRPIVPYNNPPIYSWFTDYGEVISGSIISKFVEAAARFSNYDVSDILLELQKKRDWYKECNPEQTK